MKSCKYPVSSCLQDMNHPLWSSRSVVYATHPLVQGSLYRVQYSPQSQASTGVWECIPPGRKEVPTVFQLFLPTCSLLRAMYKTSRDPGSFLRDHIRGTESTGLSLLSAIPEDPCLQLCCQSHTQVPLAASNNRDFTDSPSELSQSSGCREAGTKKCIG